MRWRASAVACLLLFSCQVQPAEDRSGLRVKVRWDDPTPGETVVHVRLVPELDDDSVWAIDASDGWPAERVIWPREMGTVLVMAVAHRCDTGCASVDPMTEAPVARGQALASLRAGRTTGVTIDLVGATCGNGVLEPGESCDGGPGCDESCQMQPSQLTSRPGRAGDSVAALASGGRLTASWLDDSCGTGEADCFSWAVSESAGDELVLAGTQATDPTTGMLATDRVQYVGYHERQGDGTYQLTVTSPGADLGTTSMGLVDLETQAAPLIGGTREGVGLFALAVSLDSRVLQLRWTDEASGVAELTAWSPGTDEEVKSPSLVSIREGDGLTVAALWAASRPDEVVERWMLKRWICQLGSTGCVPTPLETSPVDLSGAGLQMQQAVLADGDASGLVLVTINDTVLETRAFEPGADPPELPTIRAVSVLESGTRLVQVTTMQQGDVLVLLKSPLAASSGCLWDVVRMGFEGGEMSRVVGEWGADGSLGCSASMVLLDEYTYAVVFRGEGDESGESAIWWVRGATISGFSL